MIREKYSRNLSWEVTFDHIGCHYSCIISATCESDERFFSIFQTLNSFLCLSYRRNFPCWIMYYIIEESNGIFLYLDTDSWSSGFSCGFQCFQSSYRMTLPYWELALRIHASTVSTRTPSISIQIVCVLLRISVNFGCRRIFWISIKKYDIHSISYFHFL
jgi:hypothetical protein